jgi:hypothetical protein
MHSVMLTPVFAGVRQITYRRRPHPHDLNWGLVGGGAETAAGLITGGARLAAGLAPTCGAGLKMTGGMGLATGLAAGLATGLAA